MLNNPALWIKLGSEFLNYMNVTSISLYSALDYTLPEMNFIMGDEFGNYEKGMKFYIGANVSAFLTNYTSNDANFSSAKNPDLTKPQELTKFSICELLYHHDNGDESLGGMIEVSCRHSWYLWGDYQGHAYAPQKLSELIKTVCKNANQGANLVVEDANFVESSDPGDIPRYKTCESDLDFIEKKLLPFTNIEDSNVFFFVDLYNKPHLLSFDQMKSKKPKVILTPIPEFRGTIIESLNKYKQDNAGCEEYQWFSLKTKIGDHNLSKQLGQIKELVSLENNFTGKVYVCEQAPSVSMGDSSGKNIYNALPFGNAHMMAINGTSSHIFPNRILSDALAMARNNDVFLDDMFYVEATVSGFVTDLIPGDTVELFMPLAKKNYKKEGLNDEQSESVSDAEKKYSNWHQGKWIVYYTRYNYDSEENTLVTELGLIRPTLVMNTDNTTVLNPDHLYQVG